LRVDRGPWTRVREPRAESRAAPARPARGRREARGGRVPERARAPGALLVRPADEAVRRQSGERQRRGARSAAAAPHLRRVPTRVGPDDLSGQPRRLRAAAAASRARDAGGLDARAAPARDGAVRDGRARDDRAELLARPEGEGAAEGPPARAARRARPDGGVRGGGPRDQREPEARRRGLPLRASDPRGRVRARQFRDARGQVHHGCAARARGPDRRGRRELARGDADPDRALRHRSGRHAAGARGRHAAAPAPARRGACEQGAAQDALPHRIHLHRDVDHRRGTRVPPDGAVLPEPGQRMTRGLRRPPSHRFPWLPGRTGLAALLALHALGCASLGSNLGFGEPDPMRAELRRLEKEQRDRTAQEQIAEASRERDRAKHPDTMEERLARGDAYLASGRTAAALWEYANAHLLNPKAAAPRERFGYVHLRQNPERAQPLFESALELEPNSVSGHIGLGLSLLASGEREKGLSQLERAVAIDPKSPRAQAALGVSLDQLGHREQALQHLEIARDLRPHDARILNNLGVAYLRAGQPER